ncbi:hypothetical protein F4556_007307 [Kitasatospora gansuensis]|uniref:Uncharacterized protein n=1 Tax=Kitasatospora gansuensis TaxID=258050 RepID=A0A7W7SKI1_9ACTN|nr:hypothetical protein [Kitasatospora gansuensis]MBB4951772.1 hypothetical protein [Kitasatospora gansuensis]
MTRATLPRPMAPAVPIVFREPIPEADPAAWRPAVGALMSDLRGPTPYRTPLQVLEVGHYACTLVMWSGVSSRRITRLYVELEPYGYGDRELFGYPAEEESDDADHRGQLTDLDQGVQRAA